MENKKVITIAVVVIILMVTAAFFAVKIANKNSSVSSPPAVQTAKPVSKAQPKTGDNAQKTAQNTETDSDMKAIEDDLNSINDEDFGNDKLSDQNLGL
ncbi:MAG: hypothetical protein A3J63_03685 [Candidatus Moranbacteria bacterium RIFCSPHIGHO2_02_FULL_40_12b]|nr:MAG: hypothetical protein A3J63_03685 [Candidatus Moranbacteria bacterium RIFCSPHIGHO2_02_FULL_40_12b]OGI23168.1 MAG: hypothetical protein A3E91_03115 [Candidatus Moranbacteria bacterium RIFCSPHIGHO2_12_FULL_40_10]